MPSITEIHTPAMGKRKRDIGQFEEDGICKDVNPHSYISSTGNFVPSRPVLKPRLAASKYVPNMYHDSKRQRVNTSLTSANNLHSEPPSLAASIPTLHTRTSSPSAAMELDSSPPSAPFGVHKPEMTAAAKQQSKGPCVSAADLSACHICFRRPSVRSDLDSYTDCERCELRTCYICIRACSGPNVQVPVSILGEGRDTVKDWETMKGLWKQHKSVVCSRCCIERGSEGEIRCMGCLKGEGTC